LPASIAARTRRRAAAQQDPVHDQNPCETDDGRDEPRIGAIWCPNPPLTHVVPPSKTSTIAANAWRKQRVRNQTSSPEPERARHDQHCARKRAEHDAGPREIVQSQCERAISGAGDRVRERCAHHDQQDEQSPTIALAAGAYARKGASWALISSA